MAADPTLVLAWLVLAHLVADFLLQTDRIVAEKGAAGPRAWRGLALHGAGVAVCLIPIAVAFGAPGAWLLIVVTLTHVVVDRVKAVLSRRVEAGRQAAMTGSASVDSPTSLGPAWTPAPAGLFVLDQVVHGLILTAAWAVLLAGATPTDWFATGVDTFLGGWDRAVVHAVTLTAVVLVSLLIVNVRGGALLVGILVNPRQSTGARAVDDEPAAARPARPVAAWRLRLGPLTADVEPVAAASGSPPPSTLTVGQAPPARVGATIGILERLLIVTFVLTGSQAAIGFVVAAKTLARFRQLDDRNFAEYYLLGTLASVAVALASGLLAVAALGTLSS
jgi:hypothetical protein